MTVFIGTSGWQYRHWKDRFYPPGLKQSKWLEHYSARFITVEINNTFYRLPERQTFEDWRNRTPGDFVFTVKASRYLTHLKRLNEPAEPVARLMERTHGLGNKLGPILLQLPPHFEADPALLDQALEVFPNDVRLAVEFRHTSWFNSEVEGILKRHGAALCLVDRLSRPAGPLWHTADWTFLRLHAGRGLPHPCYGKGALDAWATRLVEWGPSGDIFVYFNNDNMGCAVRDARRFASCVSRKGLPPTRVPSNRETPVG